MSADARTDVVKTCVTYVSLTWNDVVLCSRADAVMYAKNCSTGAMPAKQCRCFANYTGRRGCSGHEVSLNRAGGRCFAVYTPKPPPPSPWVTPPKSVGPLQPPPYSLMSFCFPKVKPCTFLRCQQSTMQPPSSQNWERSGKEKLWEGVRSCCPTQEWLHSIRQHYQPE